MTSVLAGTDFGLGASLCGLLAFAALLLLPGLLVVRAPWSAVPFLSLSFWALSWGWLFGASRQRFLHAALAGFLLLALLRLLKPLGLRAPRGSTVLVLAAAALPLLAFFCWPLCPGAEMSFHSLGARLLVWRDGLPLTYEPLVSLRPFGAHAPALPALAADVSLLSGLAPAKAVLLAHQAAVGLLIVALHAFLVRLAPPGAPPVAALGAVLAVALARVPAAFSAFGDGGPVLALAFAVATAAWLGPTSSRSAAVAAGLFLGASALAQPTLALAALVTLGLRLRPWRGGDGRIRLGLAAGLAVVLAAPFLLRLAESLSLGEIEAAVPGPRQVAPALAALFVAAAVAWVARRLWPPRRWAVLGLAGLGLAAVGSSAYDALDRAHGLRPGPAERAAMARLAKGARPLETVCIEPGSAGLWMPALVGRPVSHPWAPLVYRDELAAIAPIPCELTPTPSVTSFDVCR